MYLATVLRQLGDVVHEYFRALFTYFDCKGLILLQLNSIYFKSKISNHVAVRLFTCLGMSRVG